MDGYQKGSVALAGTEVHRVGPGDHVCMPFVTDEARTTVLVQYAAAGLQRNERVLLAAPHELHGVMLQAIATEGWNAGALLASQQLALFSPHDVYGHTAMDLARVPALLRRNSEKSRALGFSGTRMAGHPPVSEPRALLVYETNVCDLHQECGDLTSLCVYAKAHVDPHTLRDLITVHPHVLLGDRLCTNAFFDPNAFRDDRSPTDARQLDWVIHQLLRSRDPNEEAPVSTTLQHEIEHYRRVAVNLSRGIDLRDRLIGMVARQLRASVLQLHPQAQPGTETEEAWDRLQHLQARLDAVAELLAAPAVLHPRTVDLTDLIGDCIAKVRTQSEHSSGPVTFKAQGAVFGRVDEESTKAAFLHTLRLALRHGCEGPVLVSLEKHGPLARVSVRYHGLDGSHAAAALAGRAGNPELYDWLGIELFFARELIRRVNGVLGVASWPDDSVLFTIELPRNTQSSFGDVFS